LKRRHTHVDVADAAAPAMNDGTPELVELAKRLSHAQRCAFVLRDVLGFSTAETATLTGSSQVATRVHLHAARRRLRDLLLEEEEA
jgi:DNA-directed RNA polymerase specialized sigma24 family protein